MKVSKYSILLIAIYLFASSQVVAESRPFSPPKDVFVEVTTGEKGLVVSPSDIALNNGDYYRLNVSCNDIDDETELNFDLAALITNTHLRILTVEGIQVSMQGLHFRAIQCEGPGSFKFSFYPMRNGTYDISVTEEDSDEEISFNVRVE
ncbi:MAG: hypothetical protein AAGJ37_10090 [Pseudomonadota bacterium]